MTTRDPQGRPYARLADARPGAILIAGPGFPCMTEGHAYRVRADRDGDPYVECVFGDHVLAAQRDRDDYLIGLFTPREKEPMSEPEFDPHVHGRRDPEQRPPFPPSHEHGEPGAKPPRLQIVDAFAELALALFKGKAGLQATIIRDHNDPDNVDGWRLQMFDAATHPPGGMPPSPDTRLILAAIEKGFSLMAETQNLTQQALARLAATDQVLADDLTQILAKLADEPKTIADAVAAALAGVGATDEQTAAAVDAATSAAQGLVDRMAAVLNPAPAGGDTGGDAGGNTTGGTTGDTGGDAGGATGDTGGNTTGDTGGGDGGVVTGDDPNPAQG